VLGYGTPALAPELFERNSVLTLIVQVLKPAAFLGIHIIVTALPAASIVSV
jgi:hypothetical protein